MKRLLLICSFFIVTGCQRTNTLITQVEKARESEAKNILGSWTRYQWRYHINNDKFATSNSELDFSVSGEYYDFKIRDVSPKGAVMTADPKKKYKQLSSFFGLVSYENEEYSTKVCQLEKPFTSYDDFNNIQIENCDV